MKDTPSGWQLLTSETVCDSPYLRVNRETVATPSRPDGVDWMVAHRAEAAVVAPRTPEGDFILVRQERVPIRRLLWEFPAGQVDGEATEAAILETAHRELGEETGMMTGDEFVPLGLFYPSAGFTTERSHLFLASNVVPRPEGVKHDQHEAITEARAFAPEELRRMIAEGEIIDANTLSAFARMVALGLFP